MSKLKLITSHDEIENIRTFVFEKGDSNWQAGQYQTYVLEQAGATEDENRRWFTIASAPSENEIHISTRVTDSAFKQALNALRPGETIEAHTVEGDFIWEDDEPVVLVAGGIGVTPYRSMLLERQALGKPLNAMLLYFGRTDDFAFRTEFDKLQADHPELKINYLAGQAVTADAIVAAMSDPAGATVYLSGPEPMVDAVGEELTKMGVTKLKQDWFPGYTQDTA